MCRDARPDVNGHAGDIGAAHLDLTRVNADPHYDAERLNRVDDRFRAFDRDAGAGERRDESVAGRVDFAAAESLELVPNDAVMVVEQIALPVVAECGGALG